MFCRYCGNEISDDSIFCSKCGKKIDMNTIKQSNRNTSKRINENDFIFVYNSEQLNFFDDVKGYINYWRTFKFGENVRTNRGITFESNFDDVINAYGEGKKYNFISNLDTICYFLKEKNVISELSVINTSKFLLVYNFKYDGNNYTIRFYFNKYNKLIYIGFLYNLNNFLEGKEFCDDVKRFKLGYRTVYFDQRVDNMIHIYKELRLNYNNIIDDLREEFENIDDYDTFYNYFLSRINKIYYSNVDFILNVLMSKGIFSISKEEIFAAIEMHGGNCIKSVLKKYENINEEIEEFDKQLAYELETKKTNRGRWQGGGFGITGAVKGAVKASAMNIASDIIHSVSDSMTNKQHKNLVIELKQKTLDKLSIDDIINCIGRQLLFINFYSIWYLLGDSSDYPTYPADRLKEKDKIIENMMKMYNVNGQKELLKKVKDVLIDVLEINPFRGKYYNYLYKILDSNENEELQIIQHYFGL